MLSLDSIKIPEKGNREDNDDSDSADSYSRKSSEEDFVQPQMKRIKLKLKLSSKLLANKANVLI